MSRGLLAVSTLAFLIAPAEVSGQGTPAARPQVPSITQSERVEALPEPSKTLPTRTRLPLSINQKISPK